MGFACAEPEMWEGSDARGGVSQADEALRWL